jgi:hypothetical protein
VYPQIEISDAQHIELHLRDRSGSAADDMGTLGGLGRRRHRNSERATRHAENALLRGDAGWKSSRVDHRRIGRRRLPADQLVQVARSIRIRFGLITTPFRSSVRHFWTTSQRNSGSLFRCSEPASVAESRPVQEWLRRGRDLRGMNLHRRLLIGNPNA